MRKRLYRYILLFLLVITILFFNMNSAKADTLEAELNKACKNSCANNSYTNDQCMLDCISKYNGNCIMQTKEADMIKCVQNYASNFAKNWKNSSTNNTYDCSKEEYQCISCEYKHGNITQVYYVKSNKFGNISITGYNTDKTEKTSTGVTNQITAEYKQSYFFKDDKLICPSIYVSNVYDRSKNKNYIKFQFASGNGLTKITPSNKTDNGKPFKSSGTTSVTRTCDNISIMFKNPNDKEDFDKDNELSTASEKATVKVNGGKISLELPGSYKASSNPISSSISANDFKNSCPSDIIVHCETAVTTTGYEYSCTLKKKTDLSNNYVDKKTGEKINGVPVADRYKYEISKTDYEMNCEDVKILHVIWIIIWIAGPVALIVMLTVDFARAVIASDIEQMKKARSKAPKRIIAALILALTPAIVTLIVNLVYGFDENISKASDTNIMYCIIKGGE